MKQLRQMILWIGMWVIISTLFAAGSLADRPDHPDANPTTEANGDGQADNAGPVATTGMVHGYVLDYSNGAAPQTGITVILDGGGWQAQTLTNSEGYYRFAGLGSGSAALDLQLPPGAQAAAPHWTVRTGNPQPAYTNLGFYWGQITSLPVILSAQVKAEDPTILLVTVKNQSGGVASGAVVDLKLPKTVTAMNAGASTGSVEVSGYRVWAELGNLPTDQSATITVKLASAAEESTPAIAWAALTYQEQLTPLRFEINLPALTATASKTDIAAPAAANNNVAVVTIAPAESAEVPAATTAPTENKEVAVATTVPAQKPPAEVAATSAPAESQSDELVPTTGQDVNKMPVNWPGIAFLMVFIIGLGAAGFNALHRRQI